MRWNIRLFLVLISDIMLSASAKQMINRLMIRSTPVFIDCPGKLSVMENLEEGTIVGRVHAIAPNSGNISYLIGEDATKIPFLIHSETGKITTKERFDTDEPFNQKKFYMTVVAQNQENLKMHSHCSLEIDILDDNDTFPVFSKEVYWEAVPKDSKVGDKVPGVLATSLRARESSVMEYRLSSRKEKDASYFRIDNRTGEIFVNAIINKDPGYIFEILVGAGDDQKSKLSRWSFVELNIRVVKSGDKVPSFNIDLPFTMRIAENCTDFRNTLFALVAVSNINSRPGVTFDLLVGTTEQTNKEETFRLETSGNNANLILSKPLDYERIERYFLIVRVTNDHNLSAELKIIIIIEDVNDNPPILQQIDYRTYVLQNIPELPVMKISAIDSDRSSAHNQVFYRLENHYDIFAINNVTGIVELLRSIPKSGQGKVYKLRVVATDNSPSALRQDSLPNESECHYEISVLEDLND